MLTNNLATIAAQAQYANSEKSGLGRSLGIYGGHVKLSPEQADVAAKDFESMFISQMVEQMFGDSIGDDLFGSDETKEVYKGLMLEQYGKQITDAGGIGIADYVKRELLKLQEV